MESIEYQVSVESNAVILLKAIMISGRTLGQGASIEAKTGPDYFKAASICEVSEKDYESLGLSESERVLVRSSFGEVVVSARLDEGLPPGVVFIPMGPWANAIVGPETGGCGTPHFKGIDVLVEPTDLPVLKIQELFSDSGGSRS